MKREYAGRNLRLAGGILKVEERLLMFMENRTFLARFTLAVIGGFTECRIKINIGWAIYSGFW